MKNIHRINCFFVGTPIIMSLFGWLFDNDFLFWGLLSTMLTGLFQLIIGAYLLYIEPKNKYLQLYLVIVALFFGYWYYNSIIGYESNLTFTLIAIPPILAIYLSVIIYNKSKHTNQ